MKQLEQRVETLMDMLSRNGQAHDFLTTTNSINSTGFTVSGNDQELESVNSRDFAQPYATSEDTASQSSADAYAAYDPVDVGILREDEAIVLLDEFRQEFSQCFPFVIVNTSIGADTLRQQQPFLFLSIMAAMTYRKPSTQRVLAKEFKNQIAVRIIKSSHKGLEVLQGLLVHAAYYHFVYQCGKQQLALMIQLCVALSQDLGSAVRCRDREVTDSAPASEMAESRALLGTYYLAAA